MPFPKPTPRAKLKASAKRRQAKADRLVYAAVTARDGGRCRACGSTWQVHRHHLRYRSHGGETSTRNVLLLCATHHAQAHDGSLLIYGVDADCDVWFKGDDISFRRSA